MSGSDSTYGDNQHINSRVKWDVYQTVHSDSRQHILGNHVVFYLQYTVYL